MNTKNICLLVFVVAGALLIVCPAIGGTDSPQDNSISTRIVGGNSATPGEWPWMVGIMRSGRPHNNMNAQFCGGALISKSWVVTAAHCFFSGPSQSFYEDDIDALVGGHDLVANDGQRIGVKQLIIHPGYDPSNEENDIALIQLESEVSYEAILLPGSDSVTNRGMATAIGWGDTTGSGSYASVLQEVQVPVVSNPVCQSTYGASVVDSMVCAGFDEGGKDTCQGDSGGPLMVSENGSWRLVGITSWGGQECAASGIYGVYTRVSSFLPFIAGYTSGGQPEPDTSVSGTDTESAGSSSSAPCFIGWGMSIF